MKPLTFILFPSIILLEILRLLLYCCSTIHAFVAVSWRTCHTSEMPSAQMAREAHQAPAPPSLPMPLLLLFPQVRCFGRQLDRLRRDRVWDWKTQIGPQGLTNMDGMHRLTNTHKDWNTHPALFHICPADQLSLHLWIISKLLLRNLIPSNVVVVFAVDWQTYISVHTHTRTEKSKKISFCLIPS